jgi:predicted tellurium resistance membrane protein TerC
VNHAVSFIVKGTIMEIFTLQFWLSVGAIILMDLSLGGDNAVVIAMASNRLPEKERKKAILIGTIGAVGLRMVLTFVAVWLLTIPYLQQCYCVKASTEKELSF